MYRNVPILSSTKRAQLNNMDTRHGRIQEFLLGRVLARRPENSLNNFFSFLFIALNLFYSLQRGPIVLFRRKLYFSKEQEGVQHFPGGGVQLFPWGGGAGGVQRLISRETNITCDFQGEGVRTPHHPSGSAHARAKNGYIYIIEPWHKISNNVV